MVVCQDRFFGLGSRMHHRRRVSTRSSYFAFATVTLLVGAVVASACGSSDSHKAPHPVGAEAGMSGEAGATAGGSAGSANAAGAGGADVGVAGSDMGEGGEGGAGCVGLACIPPLALSGDLDLSVDAVSPGRSCAESPSFALASLASATAELVNAPDSDCLSAGDEVLLINLQGTPQATSNVGNWELLSVASVSGATVTFTSAKARHYGDPANSDSNLGAGAAQQKVALIRVPHFGELTVPEGVTLMTAAWDGTAGGVVALRAASLHVEGTITAGDLGYRAGHWSKDDASCTDSVVTEAGESITGLGSATTLHNAGAPGGLGALTGVSFISESPLNPSAGHALPGEPGLNGNGRTLGEPGAAYGSGDGLLLTMGSGASGNVTCANGVVGPALSSSSNGGPAGGIVLLLTDELHVGSTGKISATPPDEQRDISGSGGTVFIRGSSLTLGTAQVTAQGAVAHGISGSTLGLSNQSSPGYVILDTGGTVAGTSEPAASLVSNPITL